MLPTSNNVRLVLGVTIARDLSGLWPSLRATSNSIDLGNGYANGNCVKAARFWFAYLIREPPELAADPNLKSQD